MSLTPFPFSMSFIRFRAKRNKLQELTTPEEKDPIENWANNKWQQKKSKEELLIQLMRNHPRTHIIGWWIRIPPWKKNGTATLCLFKISQANANFPGANAYCGLEASRVYLRARRWRQVHTNWFRHSSPLAADSHNRTRSVWNAVHEPMKMKGPMNLQSLQVEQPSHGCNHEQVPVMHFDEQTHCWPINKLWPINKDHPTLPPPCRPCRIHWCKSCMLSSH